MQSTKRLPLALFLLLCGFYLLTMSGHTYSADEETMVAVTHGLAAAGDVAVRVPDGAPVAALRPGLDGLRYSPYGILPSLLALPFYGLGALLALGADSVSFEYAIRFGIAALNAPITAAAAALLAAWALRLGVRRSGAICLALLYGLASFAWPYARTFFSEPLAALLILLAAERVDALRDITAVQGRWRFWRSERGLAFSSGLAAGLLLTTRIAAGVVLPIIGLYLLWQLWRRAQASKLPILSVAAAPIGFWLLGMLPGLLLLGWYNLARFGTPLASGYASESGMFTTPLGVGLYGLLLSPGKSVLLYAPPLLLAIPGAVLLWRRGRADLVLLCFGLFLSHLLLYAMWGEWEGGGVWGPRFLLPVVAPLLLLAGGLFFGEPQRRARWRWVFIAILGLLGFVGNLGAVLLNFNTYLNTPSSADKIYSIEGSPLAAQWQILFERWGHYLTPAPRCALGDGFYPTESPEGELLPRRTGAVGVLNCATNERALLSFWLDDRRPGEAASSELALSLNDRPISGVPAGQLRVYRLLLPERAVQIEIQAVPWNPKEVGFSDRDDPLGPQLSYLAGKTNLGAEIRLADTVIAPLSERPRPRWAWYYDPPNQHLLDHWAWYLPRSELAGPRAWVAAVLLLGVSLTCLGFGLARSRAGQP